jgi:DNA-binding transcriptional LysR family regulator
MASLDNFRLVVFRAVAEQRSFRKAAEELYLTQPAVSLQIKALEEDIGVQLFDRTGTRIALTEAGKVLLGYSQQANALFIQAEHEIAALSGEHAGQLALGASTTIAQYVLPSLLGEFAREHPRIHLTMISGNPPLAPTERPQPSCGDDVNEKWGGKFGPGVCYLLPNWLVVSLRRTRDALLAMSTSS